MVKVVIKADHPSVNVQHGEVHLNVISNFYIDKRLPKHANSVTKSPHYLYDRDGGSSYRRKFKFNPIKGIKNWINLKLRKKPSESMEEAKGISKELPEVDQMEKAIECAKKVAEKLDLSGQYEIALSVKNSIIQIAQEIVLKKNGITKFLDEEDIIEVLKKANFGIRLDFLEHYPQILPNDISEKKIETDKLKIFDNWAVLHFDPNGSSLKIQEKEEARRDPILFGMINGSSRLYVVADWVIGDDDLTLEKVESIIGRKANPVGKRIPDVSDDVMIEIGRESDESEGSLIDSLDEIPPQV